MSLRVVRRPRARRDIVEIAVYLADQSLEASNRFLDAAEESLQMLARLPHAGSLCRFRNPKFRLWRVRGFENYPIFYRPLQDRIELLRIVHGARDIATPF